MSSSALRYKPPLGRFVLVVLAASVAFGVPMPRHAHAQDRLPILDVHLHTSVEPDPRTGLCIPWVTQFPPWDGQRPWEEVWLEAMTHPACQDPIWTPESAEAMLSETIAVMERNHVYGVLSSTPDEFARWQRAAPGRFIPSLRFQIGRDDVTPESLEQLVARGEIAVLGEISNQYVGIGPDDPRMEPYWAAAEALDVPVAIHMGEGTVGTAYLADFGLSEYRARLSNPYRLEEVLVRHPRLRLSVMHYGAPLIDEMIAVLAAHPQVYVDLGGMEWYYPRPYFYAQLKELVDAGFGKRIMFGSDQGDWPGVIEAAIRIVDEAPFLSDEQTRDIFYNNAARFLRLSDDEIARHHGRR